MRITVNQLRRIIKEETRRVLSENMVLGIDTDGNIIDQNGNTYTVGKVVDKVVTLKKKPSSPHRQDYGGPSDSFFIVIDTEKGTAKNVDDDDRGTTGYGSKGSTVTVNDDVMNHLSQLVGMVPRRWDIFGSHSRR